MLFELEEKKRLSLKVTVYATNKRQWTEIETEITIDSSFDSNWDD